MSKIEKMKSELNKIKKEKLDVDKTILQLIENELVKKYIELNNRSMDLKLQFERLSFDYEKEKMERCNHIFITGYISRDFDGHRADIIEYPYCVKCGLDSKYLAYDINYLTPLQQAMIYIYKNKRKGIYWNHYCEHSVAKEIYEKIKKGFPKLSDEELFEHFKLAVLSYENKDKKEKVK